VVCQGVDAPSGDSHRRGADVHRSGCGGRIRSDQGRAAGGEGIGLAKGKGVSVCYRASDAIDAIDQAMRKKAFGAAGTRVVIEELLTGPECSILAFVDRKNIYLMESAQDHKPVDDGDTGPMTGGMGAYSPAP